MEVEKVSFLGATVESASCNFGFNSSPSSINISLVEDFEEGDSFNVDDFDDTNIDGQLKAGLGGSAYTNGNPGTFAEFATPPFEEGADPFEFNGIVTNWRRTNTGSGRKISVQMQDARIFFSKIPIIVNTDLVTHSNDDGGSINPNNHNIVDVFGHFGNAISSDWTRDGISARKIIEAVEGRFSAYPLYFYNEAYTIVFSSDSLTNVYYQIPINYRTPIQDTTLSQFLDKTAQECNFDWYITTDSNKVITVHAISRSNNANTVFSSSSTGHPVASFLNSRKDRLMSFDVGRELRSEANDVIVFGDKRRTTYVASELHKEIFPIFAQMKDGHLVDKMFIPLDNIHSANSSGLIENLPTVTDEKKSLKQNNSGPPTVLDPQGGGLLYVPYPEYERERPIRSRPGYLATEEMLRAALHSKESWATVVWYYFNDKGLSPVVYNVYARYDIVSGVTVPLGREQDQINSNFSSSGTPEAMGIFSPEIDRANLHDNPWKARMSAASSSWGDLESMQAIREACYQATLKFAQGYYGKVFMVRLPHSPIFDGHLSGADSTYTLGERNILQEYEIVDGSPALLTTNDYTEASIPYHILNNDNNSFTTSKGLLKPRAIFYHDAMVSDSWSYPYYTYASYEMFDENKSAKISGTGDHGEVLTSDFDFHTSDLSVDHYKFDPRFGVVRLSAPVLLGYGHIRDVVVDYSSSGGGISRGNSTGFEAGISPATQPSEKDRSGSAQSFFSWLLRDFQIVHGLTTEHNGVIQPVMLIENGNSKKIDASFYYRLMHTKSKEWSEKIGLEQKRYIGLTQTSNNNGVPVSPELHTTAAPYSQFSLQALWLNIPLKWNYYFYGPFSSYNISGGATDIVRDTNLNPWNYGTYNKMKSAGEIISDNSQSYVNTLSYLNAEIEGYPELSLGKPLVGALEQQVASSLSGLNFKFGMSGVSTQYHFKTFFGLTGKRLKDELDQVYRVEADKGKSGRDKIKLDEILISIQQNNGGSGNNTKNQNAWNAGDNHSSGSSNVNTIVGTRGSGKKGQPSVSAKSQGDVQEAIESRPYHVGNDITASRFDDLYYCSFNEMYTPIATNHQLTCEGFVPSLNGIALS